MTVTAAGAHDVGPADLLAAYGRSVDRLEVSAGHRAQRRHAARCFLERHGDLAAWMGRPTSARLIDLHRLKAWPFFTWLVLEGRIHPDLELLLSKPGGVDLPACWTAVHREDVDRLQEIAQRLRWSRNWSRQVIRHTAPVLCLWLGKAPRELSDEDFDQAAAEAGRLAVRDSTRLRFVKRCLAFRQLCFQAGTLQRPPRDPRPPALSPAEHAAAITQPAIRSDVVRYARIIATTLRPSTAQMRIKAIRILADWLAAHHPEVRRLDQLERVRHVEPFLAWSRSRPWRGPNGVGRNIGLTVFHHDVLDLRVFFEDIAEWDWPSTPARRLVFLSDLPRLPEPMPRALDPAADRALMGAVAGLADPFARCGLTLLRATGMRVGELLDLELDCIADMGPRGTWLRVPLGKLGTERTVPLDPGPRALLEAYIGARSPQRSLPHPRDGHLADFVFMERGRRLGVHRLRVGLDAAIAAAGLTDGAGRPLRITHHQLRHTFGTSLVNAGMSLPALMALLGHVTPEMTLRYARLASPTIREAYLSAMAKIDRRRAPFTVPAQPGRTIPSKLEWLRGEMLKTRLAHGFCSRDPVAGPCPYANVCEQCDNFVPDPERTDVLTEQRDDIERLRADAEGRGWADETARHQRAADAIGAHLRRLGRIAGEAHGR